LQEKDIPHHTKIREAIITTWKSWFTDMKRDLVVCINNLFLECRATDFTFRWQLDKSASLLMFGPTVTIMGTLRSHLTGLHGIKPLDGSSSSEH
jgi:hypothetical protein